MVLIGLRNSFVIAIALLMVIANIRISFGTMTCLHSGHKEITLGKALSCTEASGSTEVDETCCILGNYDLLLDSHSSVSSLSLKQPFSFLLLHSYTPLTYSFNLGSGGNSIWYNYMPEQPPGVIQLLLPFLSVFRI